MNGNYEYVRHVARDKQRAFINEAREHRLAKQAGSPEGHRQVVLYFVRAGNWLQSAANWVAMRASGYAAGWKTGLRKPGAATR